MAPGEGIRKLTGFGRIAQSRCLAGCPDVVDGIENGCGRDDWRRVGDAVRTEGTTSKRQT
jgi:hypothetical protein